jgi:hypothetical protein
MRHPIVKGIGFSLVAVIFVGLAASVVAAMLRGKAVLWNNYYGLPVGTYSTAAVLFVATAVGVVWLVQRGRRFLGHRAPKR